MENTKTKITVESTVNVPVESLGIVDVAKTYNQMEQRFRRLAHTICKE